MITVGLTTMIRRVEASEAQLRLSKWGAFLFGVNTSADCPPVTTCPWAESKGLGSGGQVGHLKKLIKRPGYSANLSFGRHLSVRT